MIDWQSKVFIKGGDEESLRREAKVTIRNKLNRYKNATPNQQKREYLSEGEIELVDKSLNLKALDEQERDLETFFLDSKRYREARKRRSRQIVIGSVLASIVFLAVAISAFWFRNEAVKQRGIAEGNEELANNKAVEAQNHLKDAQKNLLRFELSEYENIKERAEGYIGLGSVNYAIAEYKNALRKWDTIVYIKEYPEELIENTLLKG